MSRHVTPQRWADAKSGRVEAEERATMDRHAAGCPRCARARDRIERARDSFAALRAQSSPELAWDTVRARVHWSVSKARRDERPVGRRVRAWHVGLALGVCAAGGLAVVVGSSGTTRAPSSTTAAVAPAPTAEVIAAPAPVVGLVNRIAGEVMIDGAVPATPFVRQLGAGTVIATGEGRLDIQFGPGSALAVGPRSTLELRAFDARSIELVVAGTLDVVVAPRAAGQRFQVVAGDHTIEVRGTQFRVRHDGGKLAVACRHGLVAVRDQASTLVEVEAARGLDLEVGSKLSGDLVVPLSVDELAALTDALPLSLPLWDVDALVRGSAPLEVATVGHRDVRVDGVELGLAPLRVRVLPGRHTVEVADPAGRYRRAGWVDVAAPAPGSAPARFELVATSPAASSIGIKQRRRQLLAGIDRVQLARCTRSIAKAGLGETFVEVELGVSAAGAVGFLNVIDTDLPQSTARCVRDVLADVRFGAGAEASWRQRLTL